MKILFINPPYTNFEGIAESAGHMMPLCFGYLASFANSKLEGLQFSVLDAEAEGLTYAQIEARIRAYSPDVVGLTVPTPAVRHVIKVCDITKNISNKTLVLLGGIHPTVLPELTLKDCQSTDVVVIGEGEETFVDILTAHRNGGDFAEIKGIWYRRGEERQIIQTGARLFIRDLDQLPFPDREIYNLSLYRSAPTKKVSDDAATPILTSRGCAYNCIHCPSRSVWGGQMRFRSPENVVDEIEDCVNRLNLKEFNFFDDTFTINKKRVIAICKLINERGVKISWICFSRVNTIDDELMAQMKEAGCRKISFGLESGDQEILKKMRKKSTIEDARKAVEVVQRHDIPVHASFMLGNVGETEESVKKTIQFATSLGLDNATFFITSPFPGTELYDIASELGYITEETKWEYFAPLTNSSPILVQNSLSAADLVKWQKRAFARFYLRPSYIAKKVRSVRNVAEAKNLLEGFRVFVRILLKKVQSTHS